MNKMFTAILWGCSLCLIVLSTSALGRECPAHVVPKTSFDQAKKWSEDYKGPIVPGIPHTQLKSGKDLPHDGWVVWSKGNKDGASFISRLKNYQATEIKDQDGKSVNLTRNSFTPDGKWVVGGAKSAGSKTRYLAAYNISSKKLYKFESITVTEQVQLWYNSPKENEGQAHFEVGYMSPNKNISATLINFKSEPPTVLESRLVASGLKNNTEEFGISGDLLAVDKKDAWLYTIPDGGLGQLDGKSQPYKVDLGENNCAIGISPSATKWYVNHNYERKDYCSPGDHDGISILKTKRAGIDEKLASTHDWYGLKDGSSQENVVSTLHVPSSIKETLKNPSDTYYPMEKGTDRHWFGFKFSNDENFVTFMYLGKNQKGGFAGNINTGEFYQIVELDHVAWGIAMWFDGIKVPGMDGPSKALDVKLNAPAANETVETGTDVVVNFEVNEVDGEIDKVNVKVDGQVKKTLTSGPWTYTITGITEGDHSVTIEAISKEGETISKSANFTAKSKAVFTKLMLKGGPLTLTPNQSTELKLNALNQYEETMENFDLGTVNWTVPAALGTMNGNTLTITGTEKNKFFDVQFSAKGKSGSSKIQIADGMPVGDGVWTKIMAMQEVGKPNNRAIPTLYDFNPNMVPVPGTKIKVGDKEFEWALLEKEKGELIDLGKHTNHSFLFGASFFSPEARKGKIKAIANDKLLKAAINGESIGGLFATGFQGPAKTTQAFDIKEGANHIVLSVQANKGDQRFTFQLVDLSGAAMTDIRIIIPQKVQSISEGYQITSPAPNAQLAIGQDYVLNFLAGPDEEECVAMLKVGEYELSFSKGSIRIEDASWGKVPFKLPATFRPDAATTIDLQGKSAQLVVYNYNDDSIRHTIDINIGPVGIYPNRMFGKTFSLPSFFDGSKLLLKGKDKKPVNLIGQQAK